MCVCVYSIWFLFFCWWTLTIMMKVLWTLFYMSFGGIIGPQSIDMFSFRRYCLKVFHNGSGVWIFQLSHFLVSTFCWFLKLLAMWYHFVILIGTSLVINDFIRDLLLWVPNQDFCSLLKNKTKKTGLSLDITGIKFWITTISAALSDVFSMYSINLM